MVKITRVGRRSVSGFMLASLLMAGQVSALEPEHETRRLMLATEEAVSSESWGEAGEYLNRLQQLEGEKPANYFYFRGRVMLESDHYNEAQAALEKYVSLAGSEGEHYTDALKLITNVEKARQQEGASAKNNGSIDPEPVIQAFQEGYRLVAYSADMHFMRESCQRGMRSIKNFLGRTDPVVD